MVFVRRIFLACKFARERCDGVLDEGWQGTCCLRECGRGVTTSVPCATSMVGWRIGAGERALSPWPSLSLFLLVGSARLFVLVAGTGCISIIIRLPRRTSRSRKPSRERGLGGNIRVTEASAISSAKVVRWIMVPVVRCILASSRPSAVK